MIARRSARTAAHHSSAGASRRAEIGRADATRASSPGVKGSGATSIGFLIAAVAAALCVLAFAASASATPLPTSHLLGNFGSVAAGGSGTEPTYSSTTNLPSLAVEQSTGDLIVANKVGTGTSKVERFAEDGTADAFTTPIEGLTLGTVGKFQVAVDNSSKATAGNVYLAPGGSTHELKIYGHNGNPLASLTEYETTPGNPATSTAFTGEICGVAVGPEGALYVAEYGNPTGSIHKYVTSGAVPGVADNTLNISVEKPCQLAAGAGPTAGSIFDATFGNGGVRKFNAITGSENYLAIAGNLTSVAVDPLTGHLYGLFGSLKEVREVDASGATEARELSRTAVANSPYAIAVNRHVRANGATGNIYTARLLTTHVEVFGSVAGQHLLGNFGSVAAGGSGTEPTYSSTTNLPSLAVEQSTGDLIVANKVGTGTSKVERFAEDGTADAFTTPIEGLTLGTVGKFQVAVDNSSKATAGNVYLAPGGSTHELKIYGHNGNPLASLTEYETTPGNPATSTAFTGEICGVAVGPEGALYVAEYGNPTGSIHKYVTSGAVPGVADNTLNISVEKPCQLAAGAGPTAGSIFDATFGNGGVRKFNAITGSENYLAIAGNLTSVAVDPLTGHLYGLFGSLKEVREVDASGATEARELSRTAVANSPYAIAVNRHVRANGATGNIYTARLLTTHVEVFGPGFAHSVTVHPTGSGKVSRTGGSEAISGAISNCEAAAGECTATFYAWEGPQLTATAGSNYELEAWTVEHAASTTCTGITNPCTIETEGTPPSGGENVTANVTFKQSGFLLKVEKEGTAAAIGKVTSSPAGANSGEIDCGVGNECEELYAPATPVTLTAHPEGSHVEFNGWHGPDAVAESCDETGATLTCAVTMSAAKEVKASFTQITKTLTVDPTTPNGAVSANASPAPVSGGPVSGCAEGGTTECEAVYNSGDIVKLEATPAAHHSVAWANPGECKNASPNAEEMCEVEIPDGSAPTVQVGFTQITQTLTVTPTTLHGKVSATTGAISNCENGGGGVCSDTYNAGEVITLEAIPDALFEVAWANPGECKNASPNAEEMCEVEIPDGSAPTVQVGFTQITQTLTVTPTTLHGKVSATTGAISNCENGGGGVCSDTYNAGEVITLEAIPDALFEVAWANPGECKNASPNAEEMCEVEIPDASSPTVQVSFPAEPGQVELHPTTSGNGTGMIKCNGGACQPTYAEGEVVALEAEATGGNSAFTGWTVTGSDTVGTPCTGITSPCEVKMQTTATPVSATAVFTLTTHTVGVTVEGSGSAECKEDSGAFSVARCGEPFNAGHQVTVKDVPASHWHFVEFKSGSGSATTCNGVTATECTFTNEANSTLKALNEPITHTFAVTQAGNGTATVECKEDSGAFSVAACAGTFNEGHQVTIKTTPATHNAFKEYKSGSGSATTCNGVTTSECTFTIEANSALTSETNKITHTFAVTQAGNGTATVECKEDSGAFSVAACAGTFNEGHQVTIKTTPATHNAFKEYKSGSGSATTCNGVTATECAFTIEADSALTQETNKITHTFAVTQAGNGTATVECKEDSGAFSVAACAGTFNEGHQVTIKTTPATHNAFKEYKSGSGSATTCNGVTATECAFTIEANSALTSETNKILFNLTVTKSGAGSGTITSVPGGISCGSECEHEYEEGKIVTLEETPSSGSVFVEWTGACTGSGFCHVTMSAAKSVGVVFAKVQHTLTVTKAGAGSGSVACDGGACAGSYPEGTVVTLTAIPDSSSTFAGWSGAGCSGTGSCAVTISADTTATATFDQKAEAVTPPPPPPPPASKEGEAKAPSGTAQVSGNKAALKLTCTGAGACKGTLKLYAKLKQGKKTKTILIGKASFSIGQGGSKTVKVKITNGQAKKLLKQGRTVKAQLKGTGIKSSTIKLKPTKKKK